ncbi:TPM domain-containing protein [Lachnospiraceae bacterium LCP25S3_G4]
MVKGCKKICFLLLLTGYFLFVGVNSKAAENQRVFDDARLLAKNDTLSLENQINEIQQEVNMDIVVVTTNDTNGKSAKEFADDYYDSADFGQGRGKSGSLILLDMYHREIYISTSGEMIGYLTDQRMEDILDNSYSYFSEKDYYSGLKVAINDIHKDIQKGIPDGAYQYDEATGKVIKYRTINLFDFGIAIVLGGILFVILYISVVNSYRMKYSSCTYLFRENSHLKLERKEDRFLHKTVTFRRVDRNQDSGMSGSGGSTIHTSSSGSSHGGGGRSF